MSDFIYIKIPAIFRSDEDLHPFKRCVTCSKNLLHDGQVYMIEKSMHHGMAKFEYAQCMECLGKMDEDMSYPSRKMRDYWEEKYLRIPERFERLSKVAPRDVDPWINTCAVTGKSKDLGTCQLLALCQGNRLILCGFPIALSEEAVEQYDDLMSKETREEWDHFARDVLDFTPEAVGDGTDR